MRSRRSHVVTMQAAEIDDLHALFMKTLMTGTNLNAVRTCLHIFTDRPSQRGAWIVSVDPPELEAVLMQLQKKQKKKILRGSAVAKYMALLGTAQYVSLEVLENTMQALPPRRRLDTDVLREYDPATQTCIMMMYPGSTAEVRTHTWVVGAPTPEQLADTEAYTLMESPSPLHGLLHADQTLAAILTLRGCYGFNDGNGEEPIIYNDMYARVRRNCARCARRYPRMQSCSGCLTVRYCCKKCQRDDWPVHKGVCQDVKRLMEVMNSAI